MLTQLRISALPVSLRTSARACLFRGVLQSAACRNGYRCTVLAAPVLQCAARWNSGMPPQPAASEPQSSPITSPAATVAVSYSPGSGSSGSGLVAPTTAITNHCDIISEALSKMDELALQKKAQASLGAGAAVLTAEGVDEMVEELHEMVSTEINALGQHMHQSLALQKAGMHELRRTLFYATALHSRGWVDQPVYTGIMRGLTVELLRRDNEGVLAPDDVLYVSTHVVAANFYNRHLWNRMEKAMLKYSNFETIDLTTIKALTTKIFKTRRGCPRETLDMRRKILSAMSRRVGVLANDFDLPSLLGILQCYSVHDMSPMTLEPLAIRATNHISGFTPQECSTLSHVLRKWRLMRLEVCERLVERICTSDQLNHHMANSAFIALRTCFNKISDSGRGALHAEPTRQKLRAMGEQIGARLDEVEFPALPVILNVLDVIVSMKVYVPKRGLQKLFDQANRMLQVVMAQEDVLVDPATGKRVRPITTEEGRQLQALLLHYGADLCPNLLANLKQALRDGVLPDESSL